MTTLRRDSYFGVAIPTAVYAACIQHDRIARPVLPLLIDVGWTPRLRERDALARVRHALSRAPVVERLT